MRKNEILFAVVGAGVVLLIGIAVAQGVGKAQASAAGFVPLGFQWDESRNAYTRIRADGVREYYT